MDLPLLASSFATVFLAELGDKTQLAIVTISGTSNRSGAVFAGSSLALVLASLLGAAAGGSLSSVISPDVLQLAASVGFLVIGSRLLIKASRPEPESGEQESGELDGANADGPEAP
jgi:putative Ca2+/H+ antiporter (TMEM165/GDT1 family)